MASQFDKARARNKRIRGLKKLPITSQWVQGGGVPGGHSLPYDGKRKPFVPPMAECASVPLLHSDVVVDIGAYCGTYALRCARLPVKEVYAYEPTPRTYDILAGHKPLPNFHPIHAGIVGDDRDEVILHVSAGIGITNSIVAALRKVEHIKVPAVRYEKAVENATVVKIDVEGGEYTYKNLINDNMRAILIDFHPVPDFPWIEKANEMMTEILDHGFEPVIVPEFTMGWDRAGSWVRKREQSGECEPMMRGELCCGCGAKIKAKSKAICKECVELWIPKHREGYEIAE